MHPPPELVACAQGDRLIVAWPAAGGYYRGVELACCNDVARRLINHPEPTELLRYVQAREHLCLRRVAFARIPSGTLSTRNCFPGPRTDA
jgi:hypothetical protein